MRLLVVHKRKEGESITTNEGRISACGDVLFVVTKLSFTCTRCSVHYTSSCATPTRGDHALDEPVDDLPDSDRRGAVFVGEGVAAPAPPLKLFSSSSIPLLFKKATCRSRCRAILSCSVVWKRGVNN